MALRVEECRRLLRPRDIFELLPREIFSELIGGLYHGFGRGVVLLWAEYNQKQNKWIIDVKKNRLELHPPIKGPRPPDFSVFCWELRKKVGADHCLECDCTIAQNYVDGKSIAPGPYKCWAKLDEMAYPLKYGGDVRAVLLAGGQIVPIKQEEQDAICQAILKLPKGKPLWQHLQPFLRREIDRQSKNSRGASLEKTWERVENIGRGLQGVIDRLYESRLDRAMRLVQEDLQAAFAKADLSSQQAWWHDINRLFPDFCRAIGLNAITIFLRRHARYEHTDFLIRNGSDLSKLHVQDIISCIPTGRLIQIPTGDFKAGVLRALSAFRSCWAYRSQQKAERLNVSTLMIIKGSIAEPQRQFVEDFCRAAAGLIDVSSMVFQVQNARRRYEGRVGTIAHSFRTPLQAIFLGISRLIQEQRDPTLQTRLKAMTDRVIDARADIKILLGEAMVTYQDVDLAALLKRVLADLEEQARKKGCRFCGLEEWPDSVTVHGSEYWLRRVFWNLVDNAVKYSWDNHRINIDIEVVPEQGEDKAVEIVISNYGLGFPPGKRDEIKQYGTRGEARDAKRPIRTGTGWGLSVAIDAIDQHGGWLEIDSFRADQDIRPLDEELHRYLTKVQVHLPCK